MNKLIGFVPAIACITYMAWYFTNVRNMATAHTEAELFYPQICMMISVVMLVVMIICRKFKVFSIKLFCIPAMVLISGAITYAVGYYTPCCIGG